MWNRIEVKGLHFAGERFDFTIEDTHVTVDQAPRGFTVN
jgi:hypothetical protein